MKLKNKIAALILGVGVAVGVIGTAAARPDPELCEDLEIQCEDGDEQACALLYWCYN